MGTKRGSAFEGRSVGTDSRFQHSVPHFEDPKRDPPSGPQNFKVFAATARGFLQRKQQPPADLVLPAAPVSFCSRVLCMPEQCRSAPSAGNPQRRARADAIMYKTSHNSLACHRPRRPAARLGHSTSQAKFTCMCTRQQCMTQCAPRRYRGRALHLIPTHEMSCVFVKCSTEHLLGDARGGVRGK